MDKFHAAWPGREIHALEDLLFCNGRVLFCQHFRGFKGHGSIHDLMGAGKMDGNFPLTGMKRIEEELFLH